MRAIGRSEVRFRWSMLQLPAALGRVERAHLHGRLNLRFQFLRSRRLRRKPGQRLAKCGGVFRPGQRA